MLLSTLPEQDGFISSRVSGALGSLPEGLGITKLQMEEVWRRFREGGRGTKSSHLMTKLVLPLTVLRKQGVAICGFQDVSWLSHEIQQGRTQPGCSALLAC